MYEIEIDDDIYNLLREKAEPFVDSPNSVLRRLLRLGDAEVSENGASANASPAVNPNGVALQRRRAVKSSKKQTKVKRSRAAAGTLLPEQEYELPLLRVLSANGGSASSKTVIEGVGELVKDRLTELDYEPLSSGGVRWQNRIQFVRLRLIERGLMKKETPRGIWEISDDGEAFVTEKSK